jgi:hypothetical protein
MAIHKGLSLYFRWPYQAIVMNVLEAIKSRAVDMMCWLIFHLEEDRILSDPLHPVFGMPSA